jgi:inositol hexakisphosphate/diphosphoinositol-pentakisphosphate kinase
MDEHGITAGGITITKPLVEKPVDADDHNIFIYFSQADGGGAQHLFRKKEDCTSIFLPQQNTLRTSGSYIYEQFIPTDGIDIKVYTVGDGYFHAEGRKVFL